MNGIQNKNTTNKGLRYAFAALLFVAICLGCSEYNTDVLGTAFKPANSLVSRFTHAVYLEFREGSVRAWGPYCSEIDLTVDGAHASITTTSDSLAIIAYGDAMGDSIMPFVGQLSIRSKNDYALYLNGLRIASDLGPAIESQTSARCILVVANGSKNQLEDTEYSTRRDSEGFVEEADGCLFVRGQLVLNGTGELTIHSNAPARYDEIDEDSIYQHAIYAQGGIVCNYSTKLTLTTVSGDAIHTSGTEARLVKGTWKLYPNHLGIETEDGLISINDSATVLVNDSIYDGILYK